jgi:oxepin-CoA hydrolase/3-oxo-5,6-dehydrosuberyl-CoA semialdehyde dehydrogenase
VALLKRSADVMLGAGAPSRRKARAWRGRFFAPTLLLARDTAAGSPVHEWKPLARSAP